MSTQNLLIIGQGDIGLPVTNKLAKTVSTSQGWHVVSVIIMTYILKLSFCKPMR